MKKKRRRRPTTARTVTVPVLFSRAVVKKSTVTWQRLARFAIPIHPVVGKSETEKQWDIQRKTMTKNKLQKAIEHIKTKEQFLTAPAAVACWYAYQFFKAGKWDRAKFDNALKSWWRHNHPLSEKEQQQRDTLNSIKEIFQ